MSTTVSCGQCGAPLRPDQTWCSLCYTQVQEPFDPLTAPIEELLGRGPALSQDGIEDLAPAPSSPEPAAPDFGHPELSWEQPLPVAPDEAAAPDPGEVSSEVTDIDVMFSMLAAEHRGADLTAGLAYRLEDKSTRLAVMVGGAIFIAALAFVALTVFGAIF